MISRESKNLYLRRLLDSLQSAVDWIQEYDVENSFEDGWKNASKEDQFVADIWKNNNYFWRHG